MIKENIETSSKLFAEMVKTPLLIYDTATLDDEAQSFVNIKNIMEVQIIDNNHNIISQKQQDGYVHENVFKESIKGRKFSLNILPITVDDKTIGYINIIYEITNSSKAIVDNRNLTYILILVGVLLSILMAYIIGFRLTRSLNLLTSTARQISQNDQVIIPSFQSSSIEITILADTIRIMQQRIAQRNSELKADAKKRKKSEQTIRAILNSPIDAIILISLDETILELNSIAAKR